MKRILGMVALGLGGFLAAIGLTLGALALAGDDTATVVHPQLSPSRPDDDRSTSPSPSERDERTRTPSPSDRPDDGGSGGTGSDGSGSEDSGSNSGSGSDDSGSDSGSVSDDSGHGSDGEDEPDDD
jgi:hypothetical protein